MKYIHLSIITMALLSLTACAMHDPENMNTGSVSAVPVQLHDLYVETDVPKIVRISCFWYRENDSLDRYEDSTFSLNYTIDTFGNRTYQREYKMFSIRGSIPEYYEYFGTILESDAGFLNWTNTSWHKGREQVSCIGRIGGGQEPLRVKIFDNGHVDEFQYTNRNLQEITARCFMSPNAKNTIRTYCEGTESSLSYAINNAVTGIINQEIDRTMMWR